MQGSIFRCSLEILDITVLNFGHKWEHLKSSTELQDVKCIWKTPLPLVFCALWHASRILIELTVSLLTLTMTNTMKKPPQNGMVIDAFEKSPFYPPSVPCGMLSEFLLSSQLHFYCILSLTVTNNIEKTYTELNGDRCI